MAKTTFNSSIVSCPDGQDYKTWIKSQLSECKDPFASICPFKQDQEVEFENIVPIHWEHPKFGAGNYLALKFKGIDTTLSLSSLLKEYIKDEATKYMNEGGLAEILRNHAKSDANMVDIIYSFFAKGKFRIKIIRYLREVSYTSSKKESNLMNVVKVEE